MKKKGFTLVELLAVIVILAIIALIATPMILNVIDNAKKGAAEASANGYTDAIEKSILEEELKGNIKDKNKVYDISELDFINIKGDKPTEGWVQLEKGVVIDYSLKIGNYIVNNENNKAQAEKGNAVEEQPEGTTEVAICTAATTKSIDSALLASEGTPYAYGVEYNCDPGDGTTRTFFVLEENGDNVSLIMNKNIDDTLLTWCDQNGSNPSNNACNADGANSYLQTQTNNWTNVSVSLPTGQQIATAGGDTAWYNSKESDCQSLHSWISSYFEEGVSGYWTADGMSDYTPNAWIVANYGKLAHAAVNNGAGYGVRPVITISKNDLKY